MPDNFSSLSYWNDDLEPISRKSRYLLRPGKLFCVCCVCIQDQSFSENNTMKLSVNEAILIGLWARNCATIQQVLILKFAFGPEKFPGLSRNGPLVGKNLLSKGKIICSAVVVTLLKQCGLRWDGNRDLRRRIVKKGNRKLIFALFQWSYSTNSYSGRAKAFRFVV